MRATTEHGCYFVFGASSPKTGALLLTLIIFQAYVIFSYRLDNTRITRDQVPEESACYGIGSHLTVRVAVVGSTKHVHVARLSSSSSEELRLSH